MHRLDTRDPYHGIFIEETREQLEELEKEVLALEAGSSDDDTINIIFRMAHSIKGSSSTMQLPEITDVAHLLESLFMKIKTGDILPEEQVMEVVLQSIDTLKGMHRYLWDEGFEAPDTENVVLGIRLLLDKATKGECITDIKSCCDTIFSDEDIKLIDRTSSCGERYKITIEFNADAELKSVKTFMICQGLEGLGEILGVAPSNYEELEDEELGSHISLLLCTEQGEDAIRSALEAVTELKDISVAGFTGRKEAEAAAVQGSGPETGIAAREHELKHDRRTDEKVSVKVNINKINKLINLMGEFVVDKEALNKLSKELKLKYRKDPSVARLMDVFAHISYLGSEMEQLVLSTRMLPLESIFDKFPRMVRDLAVKCNKKVNLVIEGRETGIDRGIIEELVDPLNHILRNCIDHGIETEEERASKGKNPTGTIRLSANQGENHVVITVQDDGKGIDAARIREKALEAGLIGVEEAETLPDEAMTRYIFEPGFSTAKEVSEISGRGVGLDVVKSNISRLNGIIDISTVPGQGTTFTVKLPLTLAIIKAMLIKEDSCTFAIPVASIVEIIRLKGKEYKEQVHTAGKNEVFSWREHAIPLVRMGEYFQLDSSIKGDKSFIIVVGNGERKLALMVEQVIGEQEIVIKSMGDFVGEDKLLGEVKGVSGVSILGDGSFAQIVDIAAIVRI